MIGLLLIAGSAVVTWTPPTQNTDGSALTDLASYRVHWGMTQGTYPYVQTLAAPATSYTIDPLPDDGSTWYVVVTAINAVGGESEFSNVATKVMPVAPISDPTQGPAITYAQSQPVTSRGFNFRATAGFVTDGAGQTFEGASAWSAPTNARDRTTAAPFAPELAGVHFVAQGESDKSFCVDVAPGLYAVRAAAGDSMYANVARWELTDGIAGAVRLSQPELVVPDGSYADASGVIRTAAAWRTANVARDAVISAGKACLVLRAPSTMASVIAHFDITFVQ